MNKLKTEWDLQVIEGGDHSFKLAKTSPLSFEDIIDILVEKTLGGM